MVCLSIGQSVTVLVSPAKMAEPIKVPFGLMTWVCLRNHVLDVDLDSPVGKGKFEQGRGSPL